ncbi:DUF1402 family protein [Ciceribacter sp. L1K22]|nr:DUF1402 family protein [Ciceribacter sp. L1K22]
MRTFRLPERRLQDRGAGIVQRFLLALVTTLGLVFAAGNAMAVTKVPAGNRNAEQPAIPGASVRRTKAGKTSFDLKYEKVRDLLATDKKLVSKIKETASRYNIDPIHMIGAIVGEHTYNVDAYDRLQSYYVKAASYAGNVFDFSYKGEKISDFVNRPEFSVCSSKTDSYALWTCRDEVWQKVFQGESVDGRTYPDNRFSAVFFQPFYAGQTFGLGQINPLTALMMSDTVHEKSGYPELDENDAADVYRAIMQPDVSLAFMAAIIRKAIDDYREYADMDISGNPGITATLFNIGDSQRRARALARKNASGGRVWPEENYYGWLINDKLPELEALL